MSDTTPAWVWFVLWWTVAACLAWQVYGLWSGK
jgi:hypothetical protein